MPTIGDFSLLGELPDKTVLEVVKVSLRILSGESRGLEPAVEDAMSPLGGLQARQAYAGLTQALLDAARHDHLASQLQATLEEAGLAAHLAQIVAVAYNVERRRLRDVLGRIGMGALQLVDVDWRLDYHVKSSITGNDNEPLYYVVFHTVDGAGKPHDIRVACSLEEMQHLHSKIKDAVKQAERLLGADLER